MTDSLPRSQQRPPDGGDAEQPTPAPALDEAAADDGHPEDHDEQPGFPDGPVSPAEGGD
jgi:hypothetical protein